MNAEESTHKADSRRLWFEFAASAAAWSTIGVADVIISWRGCVHDEQFGGPSPHPGVRAVYVIVWLALFGLAALAGRMSYRTWRALSQARELLDAEGRERKEFMALAGFFVSVTLGSGFVWLGLPLFMLQMCARVR